MTKRFTVVTLLPELIRPSLTAGVVGRAVAAGTFAVDTVNPRDFAHDRHKTVDDTPYGGGPGMVMKVEPLLAAIAKACEPAPPPPATKLSRNEAALADVQAELAQIEVELHAPSPPARGSGAPPPRGLDDAAAEATLAELEMELGLKAPAADLHARSPRTEEKVLGPAESETEQMGSDPDSSADIRTAEKLGSEHHFDSESRPRRILMSPSGKPLTQARVRELATIDPLVLVCGRYEGIDQRVIDTAIDEEISIGDYVLSGGELAALVVIDAVARFVPGVLGEATSTDDESFASGVLEYPQYTRPQVLAPKDVPAGAKRGGVGELGDQGVPAVLQSGNHAAIAAWRRQQSLERTAKRRPDLFRRVRMTKSDKKLYGTLAARTHVALVHHPVVDRNAAVVTTAVTNFDIHDLARSSMTYGLAGYHIVTPVTSQREKSANIATLWMGDEKGEHRATALRLVRTADSIETVIAELTAEYRRDAEGLDGVPLVVATSAKGGSFAGVARRTPDELVAEATLSPRPMLLLLGTGWGLAEALIPSVSRVLAPIEGDSDWNHLSVRSAAAIIMDRLFGRPA